MCGGGVVFGGPIDAVKLIGDASKRMLRDRGGDVKRT